MDRKKKKTRVVFSSRTKQIGVYQRVGVTGSESIANDREDSRQILRAEERDANLEKSSISYHLQGEKRQHLTRSAQNPRHLHWIASLLPTEGGESSVSAAQSLAELGVRQLLATEGAHPKVTAAAVARETEA